MARITRSLTLALGAALFVQIAPAASAGELRSFQSAEPRVLWAAAVGNADAAADEIDGVSVDMSGNTVVTGVFRNIVNIGETTLKSRGKGDIFLASYARNGAVNWVRHYGGGGDDNAYDVTTDAASNIYISGWFSSSVDFGGATLQSRGGTDQFIAKYNASGNLIWAKQFGSSDNDGGNEIAVLGNGEIAVSGITDGNFRVGDQSFTYGGGRRDSYVIRLDPNGNLRWIAPFNRDGTERIRALTIAGNGDVFVGFQYRGSVQAQGKSVRAAGGWDGALGRLDSNGNLAWLLPVAGEDTDNVRGLATAPDGGVYASGVISGKGVLMGRNVPAIGRKGDDFVVRLTRNGEPTMIISLGGTGVGTGAEIVSDDKGVIMSAIQDGPLTVRVNRDVVAELTPPSRRPTAYLAAVTHGGSLRFVYSPEPLTAQAAANGNVLSVSRDGRYLAHVMRIRDRVDVGGVTLSTPSEKDSAIAFWQLNGS